MDERARATATLVALLAVVAIAYLVFELLAAALGFLLGPARPLFGLLVVVLVAVWVLDVL